MYNFLLHIIKVILKINGHFTVQNHNDIPKGNYILIAPHRTWFDPAIYAYAALPTKFGFLAKKELYHHFVTRLILTHLHSLSVDRQHPGPSVILKPVKMLKSTDVSLMIFPSGTRHSQKLRSGAALIAKLSGKPLVPCVYQGPLMLKHVFTRHHMMMKFGKPIIVPRSLKLNDEGQTKIEKEMNHAFAKLDHSINPSYHYQDVSK